ncbi:hypothetical protein PVK06_026000 [Gossypium arboreum]|uniref:Protein DETOXIFICATION n=1 Tax=Gossypium arboreum TaxID=29729 RepID=A0ABR0NZ81_GOSAR|nr:hypothetical protein PVK06_026000 [Gossypium arboreum]
MAEQPLETNYFTLWGMPIFVLFKDARLVLKTDSIGMEILRMAFPAALALAADPIASLIDTAFIGRIGAVELAAVGVSIAIFNQAARITIYPLVSITTSFVAQEQTLADTTIHAPKSDHPENDGGNKEQIITPQDLEKVSGKITCKQPPCGDDVTSEVKKGKRHIPSASTAMVFGLVLGLLQTLFLVFGAKILLLVMGVKPNSPMMKPALKYLTLRSMGAPAVLLSLAMQGIFRGFKDTKTPLYATVAGDVTNIILDPIFIFVLRLGVSGAAIAHVLSQYLITLILLCQLVKQVELLPFRIKDLQFGRFLKNGIHWCNYYLVGFGLIILIMETFTGVMLMGRVIAVTFCVTLSASMAARLGPTPMAAFQICLQVWLTSSLLADGLAVAGQAILACAFAEKDYKKVTAVAVRVLQMSFVMGMGLAVVVGVGLHFGSGIFSKDAAVLRLISIGVVVCFNSSCMYVCMVLSEFVSAYQFVASTQPINSLAFVCDGVNFGSSDFAYTAYSMILVGGASIASIFLLSKSNGFIGIWVALTIYMALRAFAGIWRIVTGTGPWRFLRTPL